MPKKPSIEELKDAMNEKVGRLKDFNVEDLLSTGDTCLNLACSGMYQGGFMKGTYILLVGDTDSGKTWLSMSCMAEATINPSFKDHRLIFDNAERGALMDIREYFGEGLVKRLEPPSMDGDEPVYSRTVEDFYFHVDDALSDGRPFIYVLDSIDILDTEPDEKKFKERKRASRKSKKDDDEDSGSGVKGSYGTAKAKTNSEYLRRVVGKLENTDSILIIINQTRDNIDAKPFTPKKTRGGGWALEFYAHLQLWSSVEGQLNKTVNKKQRQIGMVSKVKVKRSRLTGKKRSVSVPIYHSLGIDDIGHCVDYLIDEGRWKKSGRNVKGSIKDEEFDLSVDKLVRKIEREDLVNELRSMVKELWDEIEEGCKINRKKRY